MTHPHLRRACSICQLSTSAIGSPIGVAFVSTSAVSVFPVRRATIWARRRLRAACLFGISRYRVFTLFLGEFPGCLPSAVNRLWNGTPDRLPIGTPCDGSDHPL